MVVQVQVSGLSAIHIYIYIYIYTCIDHMECGSLIAITYLPAQYQHILRTGTQKQQEDVCPLWRTRVWFPIHGCVWSIHPWPWLRGLVHDNFGSLWNRMVSTCLNNPSHGLHIKSAAAKSCCVTRSVPGRKLENPKPPPWRPVMPPQQVTPCQERRVMWQKQKLQRLRHAVDCWDK